MSAESPPGRYKSLLRKSPGPVRTRADAVPVDASKPVPHRFVRLINEAVHNMRNATEKHVMVAEHNVALAVCHKVNVLFTSQRTFVDAEALASQLWSKRFGADVLDVLVEGGELVAVPCQTLALLTLDETAAKELLNDDVVGVLCGVLRGVNRGHDVTVCSMCVRVLENLTHHTQPTAFSTKMRCRVPVISLLFRRLLDELWFLQGCTDHPLETPSDGSTNQTSSDDASTEVAKGENATLPDAPLPAETEQRRYRGKQAILFAKKAVLRILKGLLSIIEVVARGSTSQKLLADLERMCQECSDRCWQRKQTEAGKDADLDDQIAAMHLVETLERLGRICRNYSVAAKHHESTRDAPV
jgi:hypothetical protein